MPQYRHGALYVVQDTAGKPEIDRALREIDPRLFTERQVAFDGSVVWCVVTEMAGDHPPLTILEWRDENDKPISDLASGIVDRVRAMERDPIVLAKKLRARNEARRKSIDKARDEAYEDMAHDMIPSIEGRRSAVLPRSQALRMSRDRMRARGDVT